MKRKRFSSEVQKALCGKDHRGFVDRSGARQKSSPLPEARAAYPPRKMVPLSSCHTPWGGSYPPTRKPLIASSKRVKFCYDKDVPLINDYDACSDLIRQLRGGG